LLSFVNEAKNSCCAFMRSLTIAAESTVDVVDAEEEFRLLRSA
jgi:hypothetical protein